MGKINPTERRATIGRLRVPDEAVWDRPGPRTPTFRVDDRVTHKKTWARGTVTRVEVRWGRNFNSDEQLCQVKWDGKQGIDLVELNYSSKDLKHSQTAGSKNGDYCPPVRAFEEV